jgi:hypothetical protein
MKPKNHGFRIGDEALRLNHNPPHEINKVVWKQFAVNETYMELIDEFPNDYRTLDGKAWIKNLVECDICENQWNALYLEQTPQLQCPNCKQMADYKILTPTP